MGRIQSIGVVHKLTQWVTVSSLGLLLGMIVIVGAVRAHEISPAVSDVTVTDTRMDMTIRLNLEPFVSGIDLQGIDDTDAAPEAAQIDALRAFTPAELESALREAWPDLSAGFQLSAGDTRLQPEIVSVEIPDVGDVELPRDSVLVLTAPLPDDGTPVTVGWNAALGELVVRQVGGGDDAYSDLLQDGRISEPIPRSEIATENAGNVFVRFVVEGFVHIIPKGLDHIVFVLGLFFFSLALRPMLVQVTAFTLAHTATLALAALEIVRIPASIVEPLIAASIVFVAVENILRPQLGPWRTAVVFVFGLLHGLGFASVLGDLGGGGTNFLARLIGFNIGVEIGQLAVITAAFLLVGLPFGKKDWYRSTIAVPASVVIALIGAYWFVERVFLC